MKNFFEFLKSNGKIIGEDFKEKTNIELDSLYIDRIGDTSYVESHSKPSYIVSNNLDDQIGILSNNFKKVCISFRTIFTKENELTLYPEFVYEHKSGGCNSVDILNQNQQRLVLKYEIIKDKLIPIPEPKFAKGCIKIIIKHYDTQLDSIYLTRDLSEMKLKNIFDKETFVKYIIVQEFDVIWKDNSNFNEYIKKLLNN